MSAASKENSSFLKKKKQKDFDFGLPADFPGPATWGVVQILLIFFKKENCFQEKEVFKKKNFFLL